jgi:hypothetical protein
MKLPEYLNARCVLHAREYARQPATLRHKELLKTGGVISMTLSIRLQMQKNSMKLSGSREAHAKVLVSGCQPMGNVRHFPSPTGAARMGQVQAAKMHTADQCKVNH